MAKDKEDVVEEKEDEKDHEVELEEDKKKSTKGEKKEDDAKVEDDERVVTEEASGEDEEELEKKRERRRQEKKERRERQREQQEAKEREISNLKRQNEALAARVQNIDQRFVQNDAVRVQQGMMQAQREIEECEEIIKRGVTEQKGEAVAAAQRAMLEANNRLSQYSGMYQNMQRQQQQSQNRPPVDSMVVNMAQQWMSKNKWYDGVGRDPDSRVARSIDDLMSEEGWDARTPQYWTEFDKRIGKYLPHRVQKGMPKQEDLDEEDDDDDRGSPTGGSARESSGGGKKTYQLSANRVSAMKEAGQWEQFQSDPKFRARMLARFKEADQKSKEG